MSAPQLKHFKYYDIRESKAYPGFFYIVSRNFMDDDNYLLKSGKIDTGYGEYGEMPEKMTGLWGSYQEAESFLIKEDKKCAEHWSQKRIERRKYSLDFIELARSEEVTEIHSLIQSIEERKR